MSRLIIAGGAVRRRTLLERGRGVSPIIGIILLVAIVVVLAAVLYVLVTGLVHGPGAPPIGSAVLIDHPVAGQCWAAGVTAHICGTSGDRLWNMSVGQSTVTLGDILLQVHTSTGLVYKNTLAANFAILSAGVATPIAYYSVAAGAGLAMTTGFTYSAGYSSGTALTSSMFVVVGTGTPSANWVTGANNYLTVVGTNHFSGATAPSILP
jgi:flagellin-like protein